MSAKRRPSLKALWTDLNRHSGAMRVSEVDPEVYAFHQREWDRLRLEILAYPKPRLSPEAQAARNARHRYNGLFGAVGMAKANMWAVMLHPGVPDEAKELAAQVEKLLEQLRAKLKKPS